MSAPREFLLHLNITVDSDDPVSVETLERLIMGALEVGLPTDPATTPQGLNVACALIEEI